MTHHHGRAWRAFYRARHVAFQSLEIAGAATMPGGAAILPQIYADMVREDHERSERLAEAADLKTLQDQLRYECGPSAPRASWSDQPVVIGDHAPDGSAVEPVQFRDATGAALGHTSVYLPGDAS